MLSISGVERGRVEGEDRISVHSASSYGGQASYVAMSWLRKISRFSGGMGWIGGRRRRLYCDHYAGRSQSWIAQRSMYFDVEVFNWSKRMSLCIHCVSTTQSCLEVHLLQPRMRMTLKP